MKKETLSYKGTTKFCKECEKLTGGSCWIHPPKEFWELVSFSEVLNNKTMQITIKGNRPVQILDGLRDIGILDEYSHLDTDNTKFEVKFKTQTPQFKVGMRVEAITDYLMKVPNEQLLTIKMVYRLNSEDEDRFYLIADNGKEISFHKQDISAYLKPYEKPKEGDDFFIVAVDFLNIACDEVSSHIWHELPEYNNYWNSGLAFKTREQAEFARERLSKLF